MEKRSSITRADRVVYGVYALVWFAVAVGISFISQLLVIGYITISTAIFVAIARIVAARKKKDAIRRLAAEILPVAARYYPWANSAGVEAEIRTAFSSPKSHPRRSIPQALIDSLISEAAREAQERFNVEGDERKGIEKFERETKRGKGWRTMVRGDIEMAWDMRSASKEQLNTTKDRYNSLRSLAREIGFEVWDDITCYLLLKAEL